MWLLWIPLGLVCLAMALLFLKQRSDDVAREHAARRRRYSLADGAARMPLAEAPPAAGPDLGRLVGDGVPIFESHGIGDADHGAAAAAETAAVSMRFGVDAPVRDAERARIVTTPDGPMVLTAPPFVLKESLLGRRQAVFMCELTGRLNSLPGSAYQVCPRVRLESLVSPRPPGGRSADDFRNWRRRVRMRAVDFVICRLTFSGGVPALSPVLAIEIRRGEPSATAMAGGRDALVAETLGAVGLPLVNCSGQIEHDWSVIAPYVEHA